MMSFGRPTSLLGGVTMQSAGVPDWLTKECSLPLAAGWLRLGRVSFTALRSPRHLLQKTDRSQEHAAALKRAERHVDAMYAPAQPTSGPEAVLRFSRDHIRYVPAQYKRYYANLRTSFEQYLRDNFSAKTRETLRRKVRKLAAASGGSIVFREYRTVDEMREFYAKARDLSARTYQERMNCGLPRSIEFQQNVEELAARDRVRGYLLFVGQDAISYLYCPIEEGAVEYSFLGYDSAFAQLCPGTVLQYLAMERLFSEAKFDIFDFTEGEGPHKELFATGSQSCADVYYFRWSLRNVLLVAAHYGLARVEKLLSSAINKTGLKRMLRDALRHKGTAARTEAAQAGATP